MDLKEKTVWNGNYKGVAFEIQKWPGYNYGSIRSNKWNWTLYLYLILDRIPDDAESYWLSAREEYQRVHYDYYSHPILSAIEFHGGITWYSKESGFDGNGKAIKVGCDFQHSWDMEHGDYNLDTVIYSAKETIDSFRSLVPGYKYWCSQDGKLHDPKDVELFPDGAYACRCGQKAVVKP